MPIVVSPETEAALNARAASAGVSLETYLARVAKDDAAAEEELVSAIEAGVSSGESIAGDAAFWDERKQRLLDAATRFRK
jgi:hypothetical protein